MSKTSRIFIANRDHKRLDIFLTGELPGLSRSSVEKHIIGGNVSLNDEIVYRKNISVFEGDRIKINFPEELKIDLSGSLGFNSLNILYEDNHLLIIDKPSGISVHPGAGRREMTISDLFLKFYPGVETSKHKERPGIVHRLDKGTSGLLILAKTETALKKLQEQFKKRKVKKKYYSFVQGVIRLKHGVIEKKLIRNPSRRKKILALENTEDDNVRSRDAITRYSVIKQYKNYAYVKFFPETGRTHQIRVHTSSIGHPVLGDPLYGNRSSFSRLALHSAELYFQHPLEKKIISSFSALPDDLRSLLH